MKRYILVSLVSVGLMVGVAACGAVSTQEDAPNSSVTQAQIETPLPTVTRKPLPSSTRSPTRTPTPFPGQISYDLFWMEESILYKWDGSQGKEMVIGLGDNKLVQVDGEVIDYRVSDLGKLIVLMKVGQGWEFELLMVNMADWTHEILMRFELDLVLGSDLSWLLDYPPLFEPSPNGEWAVVVFIDGFVAEISSDITDPFYSVWLLNLVDQNASLKIGECSNTSYYYCATLPVWSNDGTRLAWRGSEGLVVSDLTGNSTLLIADAYFFGEVDNYFDAFVYSVDSWSLDDRHILLEKWFLESNIFGVIDLQSNNYEEIKESYKGYGDPRVKLQWVEDGRILVLTHFYEFPDRVNVELSVYQVLNRSSEFLRESYRRYLGVSGYNRVLAAYQTSDTTFSFLAFDQEPFYSKSSTNNQIFIDRYDLNLTTLSLSENSTMAVGFDDRGRFGFEEFAVTSNYEWLLVKQNDRVFLVQWNGGQSFDLTELIGDEACCFEWLER